ncbi:hypothetical protein ACHAXH_007614 [Discostella pseudostelligera]
MLGWVGRTAAEDDATTYTMNNSSSSSTTTKLSAKAANSLREKRRAGNNGTPSSAPTSPNESYSSSRPGSPHANTNNNRSEGGGGIMIEGGDNSNPTANLGSGRSKVFSFFDPEEIRRPPNPASPSSSRPPPSPSLPASPSGRDGKSGGGGGGHSTPPSRNYYNYSSIDAASSTITNAGGGGGGGGGGDDASVATSRIRNHNHNPPTNTNATTNNNTSNVLSPTSSAKAFLASVDTAKEVKYEEGATELFMLVEDANWEDVCSRIEYDPSEARVWVVSSGTENTVFSWSVWRRLPLHEACRRQPPPVVIYALLAAYPESAMEENNFAELPLHAAVRCGACAEVVNCILASYPAGALARDNSGCTPLDILNGIGKMMDHDAVVAALNRAIAVHTRETKMWAEKIASMQQEFKLMNDKQKWEYDRIISEKKNVIENLERTSEQERLATSNLAVKVIQTEQVVQDKQKAEKRYQEKIRKIEEEIVVLKSSNGSRKSRIKELEETVRSDAETILELNNRIKSLQSSLVSLVQEEEEYAATKLASAGQNFKLLVESQFVFLREAEGRKESIRAKVKQLGINIPPKKKSDAEIAQEEEEAKRKKALAEMPVVEGVSNTEVAEKALASAMAQLGPFVDGEV